MEINMEKSEKKVFTAIILIMIVFISGITVVSYIGRIDNQVKNHAEITIGDARAIALEDAENDESNVVFTKQICEMEQGLYAYEIEFNDGLTRYEYEINAQNGEIISRYSVLIN